jgi:catalase
LPELGGKQSCQLGTNRRSYGDAQRYRLGVNHEQIPVNAPRWPVNSFHRDGAMRVDGNHGGAGADGARTSAYATSEHGALTLLYEDHGRA